MDFGFFFFFFGFYFIFPFFLFIYSPLWVPPRMKYRLFATQTRGQPEPGPNPFGRMFGHTFCYELDLIHLNIRLQKPKPWVIGMNLIVRIFFL